MNILYMSPTREDNPLFKIIKYAFSKSKHNFTFFLIDYTKVKGWKWPFAKQFIIPSLIKYFKFDYIMLWDDDLDIHDFDVDIFLDICKAFKLEIAQPALSYNSYCSHQITLKHPDPNVSIRITDFVEIMCPVFTKEAWLKFYPYLQDNHEQGWGYDYMFKYIGKCGIIDSQAIQHTRKINPHGNHAGLEMRNFLNKYGIKQQYKGNLETFYINTMNSSKNLEITGSSQLIDWLQSQDISLALTTYQSSRLFLLGVKPNGNLSGFERLFDRAMGLYATPERLYMSSRYQLWQFDNVLAAGELDKGYDKLYVPRVAYTTGDLDIHDLVVDKHQNIIFVNTLYNCLATLSERHSFKPLWQPPFISKLVAEDRCHLNGLAMVDGEARYVTTVSQSDVIDGWRERRRDGGCVIDIKTNEIIVKGLSMPHSPRWYQGKLWLLNSGEGEFGYIENGKFKPLTFCPGYMRGLAFAGDFAIVALSKAREKTFTGLALDEKLAAKEVEARCGLMIIDLKTGEIAHWLRIEGVVTEFYDVQVLAGVQRAKALGFKTDEIQHLITVENDNHKQALVSVIIPCYKQAHFLPEAVESVVSQSYPDWEIIIVNDGSPDNTNEVAQQLINKYSNKKIRLLKKDNGERSDARNAGIAIANGEYILPLDADDKLAANALRNLLALALEQTSPCVVFGSVQRFGVVNTRFIGADHYSLKNLLQFNMVNVSSMFSKKVWQMLKGYKTEMTMYEDWEFWINCHQHNIPFIGTRNIVLYYRKHSNSTTANNSAKKHNFFFAKIISLHPQLFDLETVKQAKSVIKNNEY